ncbi:TPA: putative transporter [Pasteurella multocida]|uniref:Putative transport protein PM1071 n=4 Tax=Pasteurella multocida TaxID=747 RepID=Y1071_PASMU|nr:MULTISPECIES: putative transporter [Pasteurella]Q9CLX8.1 RecName: Full=Putative transport protein PM1071 [Pasteurella multocida subsp. multocida str. Pm70]AWW59049.1 putative transporter [Pasteurellaceae bacterium 12591]EGP04727.1 putative transporter [Pasteurella multocida subsp. multocida str. Anand1_goat]AAK03155.1 unknown [Pasteurella multocida subsp. multocida str. Pm70]AET15047.1 putative regulator of K+ conductance protein [Pasteurella multocida 36950]AFF23415.1 Putative transport p
MSDIAITISLLALVAVIGLWIGHWKIRGVGLGIGGVLFGGIIVAHFTNQYGLKLDAHTMHFIQEFGLILFVYTIGIQVGPGFFASLRQSGLKLNGFAALIVLLGSLAVIVIHKLADVPLDIILGIYSGAVTNTPSLGAGQQILSELGLTQTTSTMGMAYAMAYPFGICGILLSMWLIRLFFRIKIDDEAKNFLKESGQDKETLGSINVRVTNPNLDGLRLVDIPGFDEKRDVVCTRLKRDEHISVPQANTIIQKGDLLHLVGEIPLLRKIKLVLGEEVDVPLSSFTGDLRSDRIVVTNEKVLGKKIRALGIHQKYGVVISRLNRAGVELVPTANTALQFGDVLHVVGRSEVLNQAVSILGNAQQKLQQVQMLPVFIGIGLGVLLGSIPFHIPGFPVPLKLGLAGGPLVVALILARIGSIGKLYWFMPPSANLALREIGIVLFLAVVGLKSGGNFVDTLVNGSGLEWMVYGIFITFVPLMIVGIVARLYAKMNYLSLCGLLAGSMTDPPALAFANAIKEESGASALSYATVYPLVMFLRIISPQLLAILLWTLL